MLYLQLSAWMQLEEEAQNVTDCVCVRDLREEGVSYREKNAILAPEFLRENTLFLPLNPRKGEFLNLLLLPEMRKKEFRECSLWVPLEEEGSYQRFGRVDLQAFLLEGKRFGFRLHLPCPNSPFGCFLLGLEFKVPVQTERAELEWGFLSPRIRSWVLSFGVCPYFLSKELFLESPGLGPEPEPSPIPFWFHSLSTDEETLSLPGSKEKEMEVEFISDD